MFYDTDGNEHELTSRHDDDEERATKVLRGLGIVPENATLTVASHVEVKGSRPGVSQRDRQRSLGNLYEGVMKVMRARDLVHYDPAGVPFLAIASPDSDFVVSAYIEHGACTKWHFGYTRWEQDRIADLIRTCSSLRRAIIVAWYDAVDPYLEGYRPVVELDITVAESTGWGIFTLDEKGRQVRLLTIAERKLVHTIRLGGDIYEDRPDLPAQQVRDAGAEYVRTGSVPKNVDWQRPVKRIPQGPFGRQLVAVQDLPPELEWSYPKQAQPWAHDPPQPDVP